MSANLTFPVTSSVTVTPSDTVDFTTGRCVGLYIGGAGNVSLVEPSGATVVFTGLLAGTIYPFACTRVNDTDTTATLIRALYNN